MMRARWASMFVLSYSLGLIALLLRVVEAAADGRLYGHPHPFLAIKGVARDHADGWAYENRWPT